MDCSEQQWEGTWKEVPLSNFRHYSGSGSSVTKENNEFRRFGWSVVPHPRFELVLDASQKPERLLHVAQCFVFASAGIIHVFLR